MKTYIIKKTTAPVTEASFDAAEVAKIDYVPWAECPCSFTTEARLLYDGNAIYVNLKTDEHPVTVHHNERDSDVCFDSCMEFFIAPNAESAEYMNFEVNAIGTLLLHQGVDRHNNRKVAVDDSLFDIKTVITKSGWQLFYTIPFAFLTEHFGQVSDVMRGNFYKCGDETPQRHYACWSPITCPEHDFHRSEFFGELKFEK